MTLATVLVLFIIAVELYRPIIIGNAIDQYINGYYHPYVEADVSASDAVNWNGLVLSRDQAVSKADSASFYQIFLWKDHYYMAENLTRAECTALQNADTSVLKNYVREGAQKLTSNDLKVLRQNDFKGILKAGILFLLLLFSGFFLNLADTWLLQKMGQQIDRPTIRYAGSPLKYSFSEASQRKSSTIVTLDEKGAVDVRTVPLTPLRDLREVRGSYDELTARSFYEHTTYRSDYLHLILTDEQDVYDAVGRLRAIYPYLMTLDYDNARTRAAGTVAVPAAMEQRTPLELFEALYLQQNNQPMSDEQRAFAAQLMEEIREAQP